MEDLKIILSLAGTILGLIITSLTFLVKFINNVKAKKIAEQAIEISNAILPFIKEAEKFTNFSGAEKKEYVLTKANQFALVNNILFDEDKISEKIEELVTLTKTVNAKTKQEKTESAAQQNSWL